MEFYDKQNRIDSAIHRQQARIDKLVDGGVDLKGRPIKASLEQLEATLALIGKDHFDYQQVKSKAHALGKINTDEALTVHNALGDYPNADNGGWQSGVNLATKVIVTQMIKELL
jgi:hypothetical protein